MDFDIFGLNTGSKAKKDLKNQDKDMVVHPEVVVDDVFGSDNEEEDNSNDGSESSNTKRSVMKTSSG